MTVEPAAAAGTLGHLGFLLARHGAIANVRIRRALGASGLTPRQGMTLMHLAESGPVSQRALLEALGVDPSVLVTILNDLERGGLAERRRDPGDRRRHIVELTRTGAEALTQVRDALRAVEGELFADLTPEEVAHLGAILARVRTSPNDPACAED
jgi:DNA-binding MarR family transcriptional regulator